MKLLLDMQGAQCQSRHRGIGRYTLELAKAVASLSQPGTELRFAFNAQLSEATDEVITALANRAGASRRLLYGSLPNVAFHETRNEARRHAAEMVVRHALEQADSDVVWYSSVIEGHSEDVVIPQAPVRTARSVATLYDLIPLHDPDAYLSYPQAHQWYDARIKTLTQCDLLLAISDWARADAISRLELDPSRVVTIGAGVDPKFRRPIEGAALAEALSRTLGISRPYVLYNGGFDSRKNVPRLIEAFARLPAQLRDCHQLVIVGRTGVEQMALLGATARRAGLPSSSIVFTGYVTDQVLIDLYSHCELFVFPSTMEGFGLPPLEAMSCGAPVIASRVTSLPEVIGFNDATFDPFRIEALADKMAQALGNPDFLETLRQHGSRQATKFSWESAAQRALGAIEDLVQRTGKRSIAVSTQKRLPTLLCLHSEAQPPWLEKLSGHFETDAASLLLDPGQASPALRQRLDRADVVVYVTSPETSWCISPWMRAWPGILVLGRAYGNIAGSLQEHLAARYRSGGYSACLGDHDLPNFPLDECCMGVLADADSDLPHDAIPASVPRESLSIATDIEHFICRLESWSRTSAPVREVQLLDELASGPALSLNDDELAAVSDAIVAARPRAVSGQWLIDVTQIARHDIGTGVQRVVRSVLDCWLRHPPQGVRIEPIAFVDGHYRYARRYTQGLLGLDLVMGDDFVVAAPGDTYVGLDWSTETMAAREPLLKEWHRRGVGMHFVVHDLLPLSLPEAFHPFARGVFADWLQRACSLADGLHCVSRATADDLAKWLADADVPYQFGQPPVIRNFPLGAEMAKPTGDMVALPPLLARAATARPTLLMVGTLEPRKAHAQALDAIERLWAQGQDVNLVIVGQHGWLVESLVSRLKAHEEKDQRLFWLDNVDDPSLEAIYGAASALLAPSLGEGYGLPLVEAAQRNLPVIARDLAVFREVMGDYPQYFRSSESAALADVLGTWLSAPSPSGQRRHWPSWAQSADALARAIGESPSY